MNTSIGFRVFTQSGQTVTSEGCTSEVDFKPCTRAQAFDRISKFLTRFPDACVPDIEEVFRELTPLENASNELGGLLESLCRRHGVELGITPAQVRSQIAKELAQLAAGGSTFVVTGIPRVGE